MEADVSFQKNLETIRELLSSSLPVRGPACQVELGGEPSDAIDINSDGLISVLRLTVFDEEGSIRDMKEQQVILASTVNIRGVDHLQAYLRGWIYGLSAALQDHEIELFMPCDLIFEEALAEKDLKTEEDFKNAFSGPNARIHLWQAAREEEEFRSQIDKHGLMPQFEALLRLNRPSIRIKTERIAEDLPIGTSRLGGLPDLPPTISWPRWDNEPFDFIGQFNLTDIHQVAPDDTTVLPPTGMLYFFFGLSIRGGALEDPHWRGGGRVLYYAGDVSEVKAGILPRDFGSHRVLVPRTATFFREAPALPPSESPYYPVLLGGGKYNDALSLAAETYEPLLEDLGIAPPLGSEYDDRPRQRVLGYADPLQSNPNINCEGYSSGRDPERWDDHPDFWQRATDWTLLFQADSEYGEPDVMLGDGGLLYFMIRPADLAEHRFEAVWTDWQSH